MKRLIAVLLAALSCAAATHPFDDFNRARDLYYKGSEGDRDSSEQAAKLFDGLHAQRPDDPRIEVYCGSLRLWEASHTWAVWKKNALSKEGIQLMDTAVQTEPHDLEIRFVRAVTDYNLPSFFHRREQSAQEFNLLAGQAPGKLEPRLAAASLYFHAIFLHEAADDQGAEKAWRAAISIAPESRAARDSAEELRKLAR